MKQTSERIVTVFGSSRPREGEPEYILAYDVGKELAKAGLTVCNGGYGGTMEASARGAKDSGGTTIGIITDFFPRKPNNWIDTSITKTSLLERMLELIDRAEAYVILKGGTGTLLELAAVWEFMNKGIVKERPVVAVGNFWRSVVGTLKDELAWEGLEGCTKYVTIVNSPSECASVIKHKLNGKAHDR